MTEHDRRATTRLPAPLANLRERLRTMAAAIGDTRERVLETQAALSAQIAELRAAGEASATEQAAHTRELLLAIADDAGGRRDRLWTVREGPEYAAAFEDPQPLISVVIPTYDNHGLLAERAIPSVLAQTYQRFEVVVVGDGAPTAARAAVEGFGDARLSFTNLPYRGPYPAEPHARWLVAGVPPYNEAVRLARGAWIAPLDDDDAFRPDHLERLLAAARERRLELAYGQVEIHRPDGGTERLGRFPPECGQAALQMALYHAGLGRIFPLELTDSLYGEPSDWGLFRRMLAAGVRMGMIDRVVVDGYPSGLWTAADGGRLRARPEWEYVPEGFDRARDPAEPCSRGWDAPAVAAAYAARWPGFLAAVAGSGPLGVGHELLDGAEVGRDSLVEQNAHLCLAMAIGSAAGRRGRVSVLDWGGALGHHRELARALRPDLELDYHVRELPAVVREGRRLNPAATFHDDDACLSDAYDLVLASSSLQYSEDWADLLRRLAAASRHALLITRIGVVSRVASFVVLQRAGGYGYATEYLGWVFNREELLDAALRAGLELEREFIIHEPFPIVGAPEEVHHRGFLLTRD
ncbi:MAG: methyltransferase, TIGR04325 family [Solirubrobacteraceae bacterium]